MKYLLTVCIFLVCFSSHSQELKKHQWKNRVLLIFSNDISKEISEKQISILRNNQKGLRERKLKVYHFYNSKYRNDYSKNWQKYHHQLDRYKLKSSNFSIILIGLDGGVKLKQDSILSKKILFTIIDGMPMRKRELNKQ